MSSAKRVSAAPDVPTIVESGCPGFDVGRWWGILARAQIDPAITKQINADVNQILNSESMKSFLEAQGAEPLVTSPEEFSEMLKKDVTSWAKVMKAADVHLNRAVSFLRVAAWTRIVVLPAEGLLLAPVAVMPAWTRISGQGEGPVDETSSH